MDLRFLLLFLHITLMVAAVTVAYGSQLLLRLAYMTGQVAPLRGVAIVSKRVGPIFPVLYVLGGILGLVTAITFGFDLLAPWLIIAYVLFAIAMILGVTVARVEGMKLGKTLATAPDGPITPEIAAFFTEPRAVAVLVIDYVLIIALLFDMVVKPFSF
jgi:hypothetical protein